MIFHAAAYSPPPRFTAWKYFRARLFRAAPCDRVVKLALEFRYFTYGSAPAGEEKAGRRDRWNGRSCTNYKWDILAGISKPGPRQREQRKSARARAERRGEEKGRKKGEKSERKKTNGAWTLRLRDHRLTLSFIMFIPQTGIVPA